MQTKNKMIDLNETRNLSGKKLKRQDTNIELKGLDDVKISSLTIHGLPRAIDSNSWIARIFWLLLFLIGFGFFVKFANVSLKHFLEHDIYQRTTLKSMKKLSFPSVTICNMRSVYADVDQRHTSKAGHKTPSQGINHYFHHHRKMYRAVNFESFSKGYSKLVDVPDSWFCFFGGRTTKCDKKMLKTLALVPKCFTFNPDGNISQMQSGRKFGLQMLLFINSTEKPVTTDEHLTGNDQDDIAVLIHEPGTYPDLSFRPIFLETGIHTKVAIRGRISSRLPAPSPSECVKIMSEQKFNLFPGKYIPSLCKDSCNLHKAYSECGDIPEWYRLMLGTRALPTLNLTEIDQSKCLKKYAKHYTKPRGDAEDQCTCPPPCKSLTYETMITTSRWPAREKRKAVIQYLDKSMKTDSLQESSIDNNFAFVSVFYDDFLVNMEEEVLKYNVFSLLSDLGGQAGLYLGASFFSIVELALVLFFYLLGAIKKLIRNYWNGKR